MPQLKQWDVGKGILTEAKTGLSNGVLHLSKGSGTGSKFSSHPFADHDADCNKIKTNGVDYSLITECKTIEYALPLE
jgi:hypothetical protein